MSQLSPLDPNAFAIRPMRLDVRNNTFVHYESFTFPRNPWSAIERLVRILRVVGVVQGEDLVERGLDILAEGGDILQTLALDRSAFEYLRRTLHFRKERV